MVNRVTDFADEFVRRSHRVNRVSAGEAVRIANKVASSHGRITAALMRLTDSEFAGPARERAIKTIADILRKQYSDAAIDAEKVAAKMVELEVDWNASVFSQYTNAAINTVPIELAVRASNEAPYQGKLFKDWFKDAGVKAPRKVFGIIESGFISGKSIPEITGEVGQLVKNITPEIKTLVRSNLLHASSMGRKQVSEANEDIMDGRIWQSTLDIRTTADICGVRDQKEYDMNGQPVGHSMPWGAGPGQIHFNCRSIQIPKIKGISVKTKRPSIGAGENYERGDNKTNRGTIRKPTKKTRDDGIHKIKIKSAGTDYESWLRTQKSDFVADALGSKEKAVAFKGGDSLESVTSNPLGTPLEINQL